LGVGGGGGGFFVVGGGGGRRKITPYRLVDSYFLTNTQSV